MKILRVVLAERDFVALREMAHRDRRDPQAQATVILERAVKRAARLEPRAVMAADARG